MMRALGALLLVLFCPASPAKIFQNSYVAFEVPNDWNCVQEGVAWSCTPLNTVQSREAIIVLAAKIAGPEDNLPSFLTILKQPKKIMTKVGTPMGSKVMYAQPRMLAKQNWVQAQHLGSEIESYYTLYLATLKDKLAILVSFSAEKDHYQSYNSIFDKAIKSLKIVARDELLFPKNQQQNNSDVIGIQAPMPNVLTEDMIPPPPREPQRFKPVLWILGLALIGAIGAYAFVVRQKKSSPRKKSKPGPR